MTKERVMPESPRVLVLAKRFPPRAGGVAQYSVQVARAYARAGASVVALTQADLPQGWSEDGEESRLRVLNVGAGSQPIAFLKFVRQMWRLRAERFQLVHATTWKMAVVARVAARHVPLLVTVHGRDALNAGPVARWFLRRILTGAEAVFAVSYATKAAALEAVEGLGAANWLVRYNGLSFAQVAAETPPREDQKVTEILSLCRLVPRKNVETTLRAIAAVKAGGGPALRVNVAGAGPQRDQLEALSRELRIDDVVDFLGFVPDDDVRALYASADIFIHPHTHVGEGNDFEGFGITIADAMSFGCAVIVGNAGGPAELVTNGETGLLVDGSDLGQVTEALGSLVRDARRCAAFGAAAQKSSLAAFSWDQHVRPALDLVVDRSPS